jgi:hypothetical protein
MRREAYQEAKERRAVDPRFMAMKEEMKEHRLLACQRVKAQRKVAAAVPAKVLSATENVCYYN